MTQEEAKSVAISKGEKITHRYFTPNEYIKCTPQGFYFEDGVKVPNDWWLKDYLKEDWEVWKEN